MKKYILMAVLVAFTSIAFATTGDDGSKKGSSSKKGIKTTKVMKKKTSNRPSKGIYKMRDAKTKEAKKMGVHFAVKSRAAKNNQITAKGVKKRKTSNRPSKDMYKMRDRKTKEAEKNKKERMRELEAQNSRCECE